MAILFNLQLQPQGAERLVEFQIENAIFSPDATPLRWRFGEYSPYLPD